MRKPSVSIAGHCTRGAQSRAPISKAFGSQSSDTPLTLRLASLISSEAIESRRSSATSQQRDLKGGMRLRREPEYDELTVIAMVSPFCNPAAIQSSIGFK